MYTVKRILFVCVENSCRSQMAEGLANALGKNILEAFSAGSKPSGKVNPLAIEAMKEIGIDISQSTSKGFNDLPKIKFDYAITLGCKDHCPFIPAANHIEWDIDDPSGKDIVFFRKTRDQIKENLTIFIKEKIDRRRPAYRR
ncbi:MAG: arsenate reductase ArsC [Candidatus Omnitrophica bacterium]|nr:arsenate reductase ArsC [Candidatus Omnitrophota bacterium]